MPVSTPHSSRNTQRSRASPPTPAATPAARTRPRRSAEYDPAIDTSFPPYGHRCPDFLAVRSCAPSGTDRRVELAELDPGIGRGEAPVGRDASLVAPPLPGGHVALQ